MMTVPGVAAGMTEQQQALFYAQVGATGKDEVAGVLLALFLGSFGLHHFYLRRMGLGAIYLVFFWTGIPGLLGLVECFFMPSRVQRYNLEQALVLAAGLRGGGPMASPGNFCPGCGTPSAPEGRFCAGCGAALG